MGPSGDSDDRWRDAMPVRKTRHGQPHKVLRLTTYQRLDEYLRTFSRRGIFHLLILVGDGGLAKSVVWSVLDGKAYWIEDNATPFGMYVKLYRRRDQLDGLGEVRPQHLGAAGASEPMTDRDLGDAQGLGNNALTPAEMLHLQGPQPPPLTPLPRGEAECFHSPILSSVNLNFFAPISSMPPRG